MTHLYVLWNKILLFLDIIIINLIMGLKISLNYNFLEEMLFLFSEVFYLLKFAIL